MFVGLLALIVVVNVVGRGFYDALHEEWQRIDWGRAVFVGTFAGLCCWPLRRLKWLCECEPKTFWRGVFHPVVWGFGSCIGGVIGQLFQLH